MKSVQISIDAAAHQRYLVQEVDGTGKLQDPLYVGSDFNQVVQALQMVNADATFEEMT